MSLPAISGALEEMQLIVYSLWRWKKESFHLFLQRYSQSDITYARLFEAGIIKSLIFTYRMTIFANAWLCFPEWPGIMFNKYNKPWFLNFLLCHMGCLN